MTPASQPAKATPGKRNSHRTREALILASEQLFGEQGIDAVSMRQINSAAGQRNSSAAHYHFGSKQALVTAVLDYRMERVNERRLAHLGQLDAGDGAPALRTLVEAIVHPIADEIQHSDGGSHYIRFMAQAIGHPHLDLQDVWRSRYAEGMNRIWQLLRETLPELPPEILGQRVGLMWEQTFHALADRERLQSAGPQNAAAAPAVFLNNLVDTVTAGLGAPVSEQTRRALARQTN